MFQTILIANRGEIACRIIRTARVLGIKSVAIYSEADRSALHVDMASDAVLVGPPQPAESYLNVPAIMEAIQETGADAVHPGYGFLSEDPEFAELLESEGVTFIGPRPTAIRKMGDKIEAKRVAMEAGVSTVPGHDELIQDLAGAKKFAKEIGYPVMLKATAGGGGKGMRLVKDATHLEASIKACIAEAEASFGDGRVFMEKFIAAPRHIEIQILADLYGNIIHLGERECSIQRRHQKVIEEAPSPYLTDEMRADMGAQAIALASAVDYSSAGTVEFLVDADQNFYFLEMNTRLQVEHPVTELVTGFDLVEQMINIAAGGRLEHTQDDVSINGWAIEARIYAEDPARGFLPSIGRLIRYREPVTSAFGTVKNVRVDGGINEGDEINRFYDPMIAKLITNGGNREEAIRHMRWALDEYYVRGLANNLGFLAAVMAHPRFQAGDLSTNFISEEFGDRFIPDETKHEDIETIVAVAGAVHRIIGKKLSGLVSRKWGGSLQHRDIMPIQENWVVVLNGTTYPIRTIYSDSEIGIIIGERNLVIKTDWTPSSPIFAGKLNGDPISLQIEREGTIYNIQHTGLTAKVRVMTPVAAEMLSRMPASEAPDLSGQVVSPMPGLLVSISVQEGQQVRLGQPLAVVEAMKMENQLFAERDGIVAQLHQEPGDSLEVGQLILELE